MSQWSDFWGYSPQPLNLDAGITRRNSCVSTYKSMPGLYLDDSGNEVDDESASQAGFDVDADRRKAEKFRAVREAQERAIAEHDEIEAQAHRDADAEEARSEAEAKDLPVPDAPRVDIVARTAQGEPKETRDFKRDYMPGKGWSIVKKADSSRVEKNLSKEDSIKMMTDLQADTDQLLARM